MPSYAPLPHYSTFLAAPSSGFCRPIAVPFNRNNVAIPARRDTQPFFSTTLPPDMPSKQIQCAHVAVVFSEKPAPPPLAWALFGHAPDCPFTPSREIGRHALSLPRPRGEGRGEGARVIQFHGDHRYRESQGASVHRAAPIRRRAASRSQRRDKRHFTAVPVGSNAGSKFNCQTSRPAGIVNPVGFHSPLSIHLFRCRQRFRPDQGITLFQNVGAVS